MHSDLCEPISFKLCVVIDTSLSDLDLGDVTKQNLLHNYLSKFSLFGWNLVETCWFDEVHCHFTLSNQYSREKTLHR